MFRKFGEKGAIAQRNKGSMYMAKKESRYCGMNSVPLADPDPRDYSLFGSVVTFFILVIAMILDVWEWFRGLFKSNSA